MATGPEHIDFTLVIRPQAQGGTAQWDIPQEDRPQEDTAQRVVALGDTAEVDTAEWDTAEGNTAERSAAQGDTARSTGNVAFDIIYSRVITIETPSDSKDTPKVTKTVITDTDRFVLNGKLSAKALLRDVAQSSGSVTVSFLGDDGRQTLVKSVPLPQHLAESLLSLTEADISILSATVEPPEAVEGDVVRKAILVSIFGSKASLKFPDAILQVAPISFTQANWHEKHLNDFFKTDFATVSVNAKDDIPASILGLPWRSAALAVDGKFSASFTKQEVESATGWAWLLAGNIKSPLIGIVVETIQPNLPARSILLPKPAPFTEDHGGGNGGKGNANCACDSGGPQQKPLALSEAEIANNPQVYTEDPGSFCKPFQNPERVLSERSFHTVLRVEAPVVSAEASKFLEEPITVEFDPPDDLLDGVFARGASITGGVSTLRSLQLDSSLRDRIADIELASIVKGLGGEAVRKSLASSISIRRPKFPIEFSNLLDEANRGRSEMNAKNPAQWDSHSLRYQATTVAVGHILEFRTRMRSNGYSLGGVARTLTLAPRQVKRIQTIQWSRSERARRIESTQFGEQSNDEMAHDTSYRDAVAGTLDEWAQGSSQSKVTSAAAGVGAVLGPVAIGGGVAHSSASSKSQQSGGRSTTAHEESQWRDAMRRHGDSMRKFESMVVQEVTQNEAVTGTVEIIRNINYAHSLTVIYHNILRHLKVETEFAGARECLFVPFAMKPFTIQRVHRWRETLLPALKDRRFRHPMKYLKDVLTGFKYSKIPYGIRADHPIRVLYGSLYIDLSIARPGNTADDKFNIDLWNSLVRYLPVPALSIFEQLQEQAAAYRDEFYQKHFAPAIAAKWCNELDMLGSASVTIPADYTLASTYMSNRTIRVDFQVNLGSSEITRSMLRNLKITARRGLSAGSVANFRSISFKYQTDYESGDVSVSQGLGELVNTTTGFRDPSGAVVGLPLTPYEQQNPRAELVFQVTEMLEHFNEHLEYYHKMIWWRMDRDKLFMLLDGFMVPRSKPPTPIASVVERDPIAVAGNCLVFRVSAGSFIGSSMTKTPEDLYNWYDNHGAVSTPMHISVPTDGLYAQTIMDECPALEEHFGNIDWALKDPDPELGTIEASLLASRRTEPGSLTPTQMPSTLIQLANGTAAPAPQGLSGVLGALQNANSFRDMAGLQGTQELAQAGLQTAAGLATSFGNSATSLELARIAARKQAVDDVDKKLATIQRAKDKNVGTEEGRNQAVDRALQQLNSVDDEMVVPTQLSEPFKNLLATAAANENSLASMTTPSGTLQVALGAKAAPAKLLDPYKNNPDYLQAVQDATVFPRPPWAAWAAVYPDYHKEPDSDAWRRRIGGPIATALNPERAPLYENTCCLRWSVAWDACVAPLPYIAPERRKYDPATPLYTVADPAGTLYAARVRDVREWLTGVWGPPDIVRSVRKPTAGWFDKNLLKGKKGVLVFRIEGWEDASGHVDIFYDAGEYSSENIPPPNTDKSHPGYWDRANMIQFWQLV